MTSSHTNNLWRSKLLDAVRTVLLTPGIHKKFEMANGEAAIAGIKLLLNLHHEPPWDDLWPRSLQSTHFAMPGGKTAICYPCWIALRFPCIWVAIGKT